MREIAKKIKKELENLTKIIGAHPKGVSVEDLLILAGNTIRRRTMQYRLSTLVKSGILRHEMSGKKSKYYLNEKEVSQITFSIPLSLEGKKLQKLISSPLELRKPVSYQRKFLDSCIPNQTFYLSHPILEKLAQIGSGVPQDRPAGTYARKIYQRLLVDLSWNSSRLEGNTYSLLETERLLATGEEVIGKNPMDAQMILNHKEAIEFIVDMAEEIDINRHTILNIHALLSNNLLLNPAACGRLRTLPVKIGKSVYHPTEVPQLIEECFDLILQKACLVQNPFEQSFFLMVQLPYLQPFLDVNKRVSRIAGNIPLLRKNLSPLSFIDVPEADYVQGLLAVYELNQIELFRDVFVWAYERSASLYQANLEAMGQPDLFRMQYRDPIRKVVQEVIVKPMNKEECSSFTTQFAHANIPLKDQSRFIEVIESELLSLHEGNFARFKIKPPEFFKWKTYW